MFGSFEERHNSSVDRNIDTSSACTGRKSREVVQV